MSVRILKGDARALDVADESVQMVVTSPPYWGLRSYSGEQTSIWGGSPACKHDWATESLEVETTESARWNHAQNGEELRTGRHQTRFKGDRAAINAERTFEKVTRAIHVNTSRATRVLLRADARRTMSSSVSSFT